MVEKSPDRVLFSAGNGLTTKKSMVEKSPDRVLFFSWQLILYTVSRGQHMPSLKYSKVARDDQLTA
jgi:hypothetical protein